MQPGHAYLSQHYKWAINKVFRQLSHNHVIILEVVQTHRGLYLQNTTIT